MRNNKYSDLKIADPRFASKIESFRDGKITAPIYVRIKPINLCNHSCSWCVYKADRRKGNETHMTPIKSDMHTDMVESDRMPLAKLLEVLSDFKDIGVKAVTYSGGGEPLIYKDIVEVMQRTLNYGIDLSIITNGQLLKDDKAKVLSFAKWVRVSMDYTTPQQMAHTRIVPERMFQEVLDNISNFAKIKQPDCDLSVNFIVHKDNCEGLFNFCALLKNAGVENVRFSPMWCPSFKEYHMPIKVSVEEQLRECQKLVDDKFSVNSTYDINNPAHSPERAYSRCYFMQTVPVIGADQRVYACHNKAYDMTGCIGSIADKSFKELWFSQEAKLFFEKLNPKCDCCHQCANDSKNKHIMNLITSAVDNFV